MWSRRNRWDGCGRFTITAQRPLPGFLAAGEYHEGALEEVFTGTPEYGGDGFVYASERPGLGVDINEEAAAKYPCRVDVPTWTQTRNQDGSLQTP